jgi:FMN reductase
MMAGPGEQLGDQGDIVPRIAVVVGNPKPASRTLNVATTVADVLAAELALNPGHLVVDLAEYASDLFDWGAPRLTELTAQVASAGLIIAASPTYKATYTGMLKAFFDRYGSNGLAGSVAVPLMTGGAPIHALAVEVHLRPLLVELGAAVPSRGLYVTEPEFGELTGPVGRWAEAAIPLLRPALR